MAARSSVGVMRLVWPAVAVVAVVVVALAVLGWISAPVTGDALVLVEFDGEVVVSDADRGAKGAEAGMRVGADEQVRTGPGASAVLESGQARILIEPATAVRVAAIRNDVISVELEDGRVRADVKGGRRAVRIGSGERAVSTLEGAVRVAVDGGVFGVEVERGSVSTQGLGGVERVQAGESAIGLPDGSAVLGAIPENLLVDVAWPDVRRTRERSQRVRGVSSPGASVVVTGGVVDVQTVAGPDGAFEVTVQLREGQHDLAVVATDAFGRSITDQVVLELDTTAPVLRGGSQGP